MISQSRIDPIYCKSIWICKIVYCIAVLKVHKDLKYRRFCCHEIIILNKLKKV